jgi:hypothetical protein
VVFRALNGVMAALFALAVLVQYNDPDPVRWMAIYGTACVVSMIVAGRGSAPLAVSSIVGVIALVWAVMSAPKSLDLYAHMFDSWEMKLLSVEEARETSGLLIVAVWMAVITWRHVAAGHE